MSRRQTRELSPFEQANQVDTAQLGKSSTNIDRIISLNNSNKEPSTLPSKTPIRGVDDDGIIPDNNDSANNFSQDKLDEIKKKHKECYQQSFKPKIAMNGFLNLKECELLIKHGVWLNALANGDIEPFTKEQKDFLINIHEYGNIAALSFYEQLWMKYKAKKNALLGKDGSKIEAPMQVTREQRVRCY